MLATGVASGAGFNRNNYDAVNERFGLFRCAQRLFVIHLADGVAAIRDCDNDFPALPCTQGLRREEEDIKQGRRRTSAEVVDDIVDPAEIGRERHYLGELLA